jgi:uncharacterized protein (DUF1015 family)
MPSVHPFAAVTYSSFARPGSDLSALVAPPYDVLDASGKAKLLGKSAHNIVAVDLPHIPAKQLGPASAYEGAAKTLGAWLSDGTLVRSQTPAIYCYRETFAFAGKTHQRTGMACTLDVKAFGPAAGGGILPHEETFSGPKEDRMALMKATKMQLSPIFGLHADEQKAASKLLASICASRRPDVTAKTDDGTLHEVWTITDAATIGAYQQALANEDVFIADGHHRYTTALNYLRELEQHGGVGADHPARRCMFVLISMSDPGTVIGPTHRVLGGMKDYSWDKFVRAGASYLRFESIAGDLHYLEKCLHDLNGMGNPRVGVYDFATKHAAIVIPASPDPLASEFAGKPKAWRELDVAFIQYVIVNRICQPQLNAGQAVTWAFPHSIDETLAIGAGQEMGSGGGKGFVPQLAVIVRPTPLEAVRAVSKANELMPQKSTFFYPKLATGLFVNPLA